MDQQDYAVAYKYDPFTGVYEGTEKAPKNPEGDGYLVPAFATLLEPKQTPPGFIAVFIQGEWVLALARPPKLRAARWRLILAVRLVKLAGRISPDLNIDLRGLP